MNPTKEQLWLERICEEVESDFAFDMNCRAELPDQKEFTQEEAKAMGRMIGKIYKWAHRIHCSCGNDGNPENMPVLAADQSSKSE